MNRSYKPKNAHKLSGDLDERINKALDALADPNYVEEVAIERSIRHKKTNPYIELRSIVGGVARATVHAQEGYGYLVRLVINGAHGIKNIPHHIRELNQKRVLLA